MSPVAVAAGVATTATVVAAATGAAIGGIVAGASEIAAQCYTVGSDKIDYSSIAIETFVGSAHGAVDGVSSTATKAGVRVACKVGKVAISALGTAGRSISEENTTTQTVKNVGTSVMSSVLLQGAFLGNDFYTGKLNNGCLNLYQLDGKTTYGIFNMFTTASARIMSVGWRVVKNMFD